MYKVGPRVEGVNASKPFIAFTYIKIDMST